MTRRLKAITLGAFALSALALSLGVPAHAWSADSQRLTRALDYIADEQWTRAVEELRAALKDPRGSAPDEAMFWLAHSLYHVGEVPAALETVDTLERAHPRSPWIRPARALRIEIAHRLHREDMLWRFVAPGAPVPPEAPAAPSAPERTRIPVARPVPPSPAVPPTPRALQAAPKVHVTLSDMDLRIQALSGLMDAHAERVIPMLKEIVIELQDVDEARRALFVLAQSSRADARSTVFDVARTGPEPIRVAAVRELGRIDGPDVNRNLLVVYTDGTPNVRRQVVRTLGQRGGAEALLDIARKEADRELRDAAIVMLGRARGQAQLRVLYESARPDMKRPLITALFNAGADEELILIARRDSDEAMRKIATERLRLLDTEKARVFLASLK